MRAFVIAGVAGPTARKVRIRWTGGAKRLTPGPHGTYFVVLPARARLTDTGIFVRHADGTTRGADYRGPTRSSRAIRGSVRVERTVLDLVGGTPKGLLSWRARGGLLCHYVGDLVSGRVGALRGSTFGEYPINDGGSCAMVGGVREPLSFGVTTGPGSPTIVDGFARGDVRTVTLDLADGTERALALSTRRLFAAVLPESAEPVSLTATLTDGSERTTQLGRPPKAMRSRL